MSELKTRVKDLNLKGLTIFHLNIRSLLYKLDQVKLMLMQANIDIMCITETWLNNNISNHELTIQGYKLVRKDRTTKRGGGIIAYIRNDIDYDEIDESKAGETQGPQIETLWIKINFKHTRPILLCIMYNPPNCSLTNALSELGLQTKQYRPVTDHEIYMLGDINVNMLQKNTAEKKLNKWFCFNNGLEQIITEPTRITQTSSTLIDINFTNVKNRISQYGNVETCASDHYGIYLNRKIMRRQDNKTKIKARSYKKYKKDDFIASLDAHDWEDIYQASGPSPKWDMFKRVFITYSDKHAPYKDMNITENKPHWLSNDLFELMNTRDALFKKAKRTKCALKIGLMPEKPAILSIGPWSMQRGII